MGKSTFGCEWLPSLFKQSNKVIIVKFFFEDYKEDTLDNLYAGIIAGRADVKKSQFLNVLHHAYKSNNCVGVSVKESHEMITLYKDDPRACGENFMKISLLYHMSCKYAGFNVKYGDTSFVFQKYGFEEIHFLMNGKKFLDAFPIFKAEFPSGIESWSLVRKFCFGVLVLTCGTASPHNDFKCALEVE